MFLKNKKPSPLSGTKVFSAVPPWLVKDLVETWSSQPLSYRDNRRILPAAKSDDAFTAEVCPYDQGRQASSTLLSMLPWHLVGLTPRSPGSLRDGLILLP
jgi:hypothetical protein